MKEKKTIKVLITGSVHDGTKYLEGVNELPLDQAISLIESRHAELVPDLQFVPSDPPANDPPIGENSNTLGDEGNKTPDLENSNAEIKTDSENKESDATQENKTPETKASEPGKEKSDSENSENKNSKSGKKK